MNYPNLSSNNAPDFARGTYIWRLVLADEPNALEGAARGIEVVANLLDRSARQIVFVSGAIGSDAGLVNWDGCWPYLGRASFRINHDWDYLSRFMLDMRALHRADISFHVNLTDVNVGLSQYPETRAFFEQMREARALYTRPGTGRCGMPFDGAAYVPQTIPVHEAKMPYCVPGEPTDIFALVDYLKFWQSGLASDSIDALYRHLPYAPPLIYWDVMNCAGINCCVGFPDGELGGSKATQLEGRARIIEEFRARGTEPGGEGPVDFARYGWCHGGLASNDYSIINSGFGQGVGGARGGKGAQVYGNQGGYHHQVNWSAPHQSDAATQSQTLVEAQGLAAVVPVAAQSQSGRRLPTPLRADQSDGLWLHGEAHDIASNFYLSVIQELFHIGNGAVRLPGGASFEREDEREGRAEFDSLTIRRGDWQTTLGPGDAQLTGTAQKRAEPRASDGTLICALDVALFNGATWEIEAAEADNHTLLFRYLSPQGGTLHLDVNGEFVGELALPATSGGDNDDRDLFSDFATKVFLRQGANTLHLYRGAIYASWSDETKARWDRHGFRSWNGEVVFAHDFDRMWPDSWSQNGQLRLLFFSVSGTSRSWALPVHWPNGEADFYALSEQGHRLVQRMVIENRTFSPVLDAGVPYILVRL